MLCQILLVNALRRPTPVTDGVSEDFSANLVTYRVHFFPGLHGFLRFLGKSVELKVAIRSDAEALLNPL